MWKGENARCASRDRDVRVRPRGLKCKKKSCRAGVYQRKLGLLSGLCKSEEFRLVLEEIRAVSSNFYYALSL